MTIAVGAMEISAARNSVLRGLMKPLLLIGCGSACSNAPPRNIGASPRLAWDGSYKHSGVATLSAQRRTAKTRGFAAPLDHLDVTGSDEAAVLPQSGLIVLPGELHRFGGELSQLNEIGVLQGLDVDVCIHGRTIAHGPRAWREPLLKIWRLRCKCAQPHGTQFTTALPVLSYLRVRLQCAMPQS